MKKSIKKILKPFVPPFLLDILKKRNTQIQFKEWQKIGCPIPPPHIIKQIVISEYQEKFGFTTFVETGTYMGDMVEAQKKRFQKIISVELGCSLFENAKEKFKNDRNVTIIQGDSGKVLPQILKDINTSALFWLDGHFSAGITAKGEKECPILLELDAILNSRKLNHIILIDDARCFTGEGDYPTIEQLREFIRSKNKKYQVEVKYDIIRLII